jgi:hypothetical protein
MLVEPPKKEYSLWRYFVVIMRNNRHLPFGATNLRSGRKKNMNGAKNVLFAVMALTRKACLRIASGRF